MKLIANNLNRKNISIPSENVLPLNLNYLYVFWLYLLYLLLDESPSMKIAMDELGDAWKHLYIFWLGRMPRQDLCEALRQELIVTILKVLSIGDALVVITLIYDMKRWDEKYEEALTWVGEKLSSLIIWALILDKVDG